jgi:arginyl-tRNA synthetase
MELNLTKIIVKKFKSSFQKNGFDQIVPEIKISDRPELSEFQCNDALKLAKLVSKSPRLVAENILSKLDKKIFSNISIDGPGFINMTVNPEVVSELAKNIVNDTMLGFVQQKKEKIVIDYAGMNIAKVMHIGHLRSNIVGQAIYNLGKFVGKEMIGDAHIGD